MTPFRIAYVDEDSMVYTIAENMINGLFFIDMILNFFMAYFDSNKEIVISRKVIQL